MPCRAGPHNAEGPHRTTSTVDTMMKSSTAHTRSGTPLASGSNTRANWSRRQGAYLLLCRWGNRETNTPGHTACAWPAATVALGHSKRQCDRPHAAQAPRHTTRSTPARAREQFPPAAARRGEGGGLATKEEHKPGRATPPPASQQCPLTPPATHPALRSEPAATQEARTRSRAAPRELPGRRAATPPHPNRHGQDTHAGAAPGCQRE